MTKKDLKYPIMKQIIPCHHDVEARYKPHNGKDVPSSKVIAWGLFEDQDQFTWAEALVADEFGTLERVSEVSNFDSVTEPDITIGDLLKGVK